MSTRIKLYRWDRERLYFCRFPETLDVDKAIKTGWRTKKQIHQSHPRLNIADAAIEMHLNHPLPMAPSILDNQKDKFANEILSPMSESNDKESIPAP